MLERIVVTTSRTSPNVEPLLRLVNNLPIEEAILAHCVESVLPDPGRDRAARERAQRNLAEWVAQAQPGTNVCLSAHVTVGIPAQQMLSLASGLNADTIVVSAFVSSPWEDYFLGSTAFEMIRNARTNMLVLHPPSDQEQIAGGLDRPLLEHALFPTDFSGFSVEAFEQFVSLAEKGLQRVSLLHVQDVTHLRPHLMDRISEFDRIDLERLDGLAQRLAENGVESACHVELGVPEQTINRMAGNLDVSCIVIGSRGRSLSEAVRWGSVSERVVRGAEVPVLVMKQQTADE
jgi:nucleotide-binding universal stress UspA family protein